MENTVVSDDPIRWKKIGGGPLYFKNRIIKPGQVFTARPSEISKAFRDVIIAQDEIKSEVVPPIEVIKGEYSVKPRGKSKIWFDVVNAKDKVVNEKALTKESAEKLAHDLMK